MKKRSVVILLLVFGTDSAQASDATSEQDYFQELPVVLSASRLAQPQSEAPNAMTIIDRKMIVASGFRTIPDLFKLVPGMYVGYYKGNQPFVSYHGSPDQYARRMQVMIDGRSVYMPPMSMVEWTTLPITVDDIERIEVIRGPAAASHGANSTQGVISITTRDAGAVSGKHISVTRGDKGVNDVAARFGRRGESFDYRMTVAYTADNGYDNLTTPPNGISIPAASAYGILNNSFDDNQARLMNYRAGFHPNEIDSFDLQFGFNRNIKAVGWTDAGMNKVHNLISNAGSVQLGWIRALENAAELKLNYYHMRLDQQEVFPCANGGVVFPGSCGQSVNAGRDNIEVQHTLPLTNDNRLVYGAAYRNDRVDGKGNVALLNNYASSSSFNIDELRFFAQDEWRITPNILLNSGGMLERDGFGNRNFSPRLSLNYHVIPKHTLRIGSSVAYRTPSLMETNFPSPQPGELFVVNPTQTSTGLRPEKLVSREIGYIGEFDDWHSTIDMRVFSDLLSKGIFQNNNAFVNAMSAEYLGLEATLKHSFDADSDLTVNFAHELSSSNGPALAAAGYNYIIDRTNTLWNRDIMAGSTPRNSASVLYSRLFSGDVSFSAAYYYQSAMQPLDRGTLDFQPTQRRTDVRVAKGFRDVGGLTGDVALVVQNLFDQTYTDYVANSLNSRRAHAKLTLNW